MKSPGLADRVIELFPGAVPLPERLLLEHSKGRVLFVVGAGVSRQAGVPDFGELVVDVYKSVDTAVHSVLAMSPPRNLSTLSSAQAAEVLRFESAEYDVVLGMLERRIDGDASPSSKVREAIAKILGDPSKKSAPIHRAIMRLADRGGISAIITTNFERLLQQALPQPIETYSLGEIPRPHRGGAFSGVLHIHGSLSAKVGRTADLIVSDRDFGEYYLRRRAVSDFIYDAARLFSLVLVGYRANDPPMRYLLNAVAADGTRFDDLKERFVFVGTPLSDPVAIEDWRARGITPITYDSSSGHSALANVLRKWSELSPFAADKRPSNALLRRIVKFPHSKASAQERDLFAHLVRRGNNSERVRIGKLASSVGADLGWLDAFNDVLVESPGA